MIWARGRFFALVFLGLIVTQVALLGAAFGSTTSIVTIASDAASGASSLAVDGGQKLFQDSFGKLIAVFVDSSGRLAVTYANSDPTTAASWAVPVKSPAPSSSYARPAGVLVSSSSLRIIVEGGSGSHQINDVPVTIQRDSSSNIIGVSFGGLTRLDGSGLAGDPAAILAHNGDILAVWNWFTSGDSSRLKAFRWKSGTGWVGFRGSGIVPDDAIIDSSNRVAIFPNIIQRQDNRHVYVVGNRGDSSSSTPLVFNKATFDGANWSWGTQNLNYETNAARGLSDATSFSWDPARSSVVVAYDISQTEKYGVFTLDSSDRKSHIDTPSLIMTNNEWGSIEVDETTGQYYLFTMDTASGATNGKLGYTRRVSGSWSSSLTIIDSDTSNVGVNVRRVGSSGSIDLLYTKPSGGQSQLRFVRIAFAPPASGTPTSLTISSSPNPANTTQQVTVSGLLTDAQSGQGVGGRTVNIEQSTDQLNFVLLGQATTASDGSYQRAFSFAAGPVYLRCSFLGDSTYSPSTSPILTQIILVPDLVPPSQPQNLRATAVNAARIDLSWQASTDNVGVAGYDIFRDGVKLATVSGSSTTYSDTSVAPSTRYTYTVVAFDAAENRSNPSDPVSAAVYVFTPTADASIAASLPDSNFGSASTVVIDNRPVWNFLLEFEIKGLGPGHLTSAKLSLFTVDSSNRGGDFYTAAPSWSEANVTWNNAPAVQTLVGSLGSVSAGSSYNIDVTSFVTGESVLSLRTTTTSSNGADYSSKEGANHPQLIITLSNLSPQLSPIGSKSVDEETLLGFTATAADPDGDPLTFSLGPGAPTGAAITSTGVFSWTPNEQQGPVILPITIAVSDGSLTDSETITVTVNEVNKPPVLSVPGAQSVNEQTLVSFTVVATDADLPANTLTLSVSGKPAGATFNTASGAFSWTPSEAQGPGTYVINFTATDNGVPSLSDTRTVAITVGEVNQAPVLAAIGDKSVNERTLLTFTAKATDVDIPVQTLTFNLEASPTGTFPTGASMTTAGLFSWTPTEEQGPGTYKARILVSDGPAAAFEDVTITVNDAPLILVFTPIADAGVRLDQASSNFGSSSTIIVDNSPVWNFLIKFNVTGIGSGNVMSAKLRLFNVDSSDRGGDFHIVAATWSEGNVTWNNAPAAQPTIVASLGSVTSGNWYEVDLTSTISGDGIVSLRITSSSTNGADYSSKEGANPPQLVVTIL